MKNSYKINNIPKLEGELQKVYDSTNPETINEYVSSQPPTFPSDSRLHRIGGCWDCPYASVESRSAGVATSVRCYWDGSGSNIARWATDESTTVPPQCPLRQKAVITVLKTKEGEETPEG